MHSALKNGLKSLLSLADVRLVNKNWGPRGFAAAFEKIAEREIQLDVIFDIGAAKGTWTEEVRSFFPEALYVLVDPLPENLEPLGAVAVRCRNALVVAAAVGARSETREFRIHGDQSSFLNSLAFPGESITVPVRTCDGILDDVWPPHRNAPKVLLKIDVQGFEMEVLRGADRTLECTDALLVEVSIQRIYEGNPRAHEVIAYLGARGFCIYDIASYVQRPYDRALTQVDLVFVRETAPLMSYVGWR